jgi:hypothetical protein
MLSLVGKPEAMTALLQTVEREWKTIFPYLQTFLILTTLDCWFLSLSKNPMF